MDTPRDKQRCLGLRKGKSIRTDSRVKYRSLETKPSRTGHHDTDATPKPPGRLRHLEGNHQASQEATETPKSPNGGEARLAVSTGKFRPYRLTLSKRLRDTLTARRLEFQAANEPLDDKEDGKEPVNEDESTENRTSIPDAAAFELREQVAEPQDDRKSPRTPRKSHDRALLIARIEEAKRNHDAQERKELRKKTELQASINMWRKAFVRSMNELQDGLTSGTDMASIMQQLQIPEHMLKYLSE